MDKGIEEKISGILSSPDEMKKIMELASTLGLGKKEVIETEAVEKSEDSSNESEEINKDDLSAVEKLIKTGKDERIQLLSALKPYLKGTKRERVDTLLRLLNAAEILLSAKNLF